MHAFEPGEHARRVGDAAHQHHAAQEIELDLFPAKTQSTIAPRMPSCSRLCVPAFAIVRCVLRAQTQISVRVPARFQGPDGVA
jgi:hypothetical protein